MRFCPKPPFYNRDFDPDPDPLPQASTPCPVPSPSPSTSTSASSSSSSVQPFEFRSLPPLPVISLLRADTGLLYTTAPPPLASIWSDLSDSLSDLPPWPAPVDSPHPPPWPASVDNPQSFTPLSFRWYACKRDVPLPHIFDSEPRLLRFFPLIVYVFQTSKDPANRPEMGRFFSLMPTSNINDWRDLCISLTCLGVGGGQGRVDDIFFTELDDELDGRRVRDGVFKLVFMLLMREREDWKWETKEWEDEMWAEMVWNAVESVLGDSERFGKRMGEVLGAAVEDRMVLDKEQMKSLEMWKNGAEDWECFGGSSEKDGSDEGVALYEDGGGEGSGGEGSGDEGSSGDETESIHGEAHGSYGGGGAQVNWSGPSGHGSMEFDIPGHMPGFASEVMEELSSLGHFFSGGWELDIDSGGWEEDIDSGDGGEDIDSGDGGEVIDSGVDEHESDWETCSTSSQLSSQPEAFVPHPNLPHPLGYVNMGYMGYGFGG